MKKEKLNSLLAMAAVGGVLGAIGAFLPHTVVCVCITSVGPLMLASVLQKKKDDQLVFVKKVDYKVRISSACAAFISFAIYSTLAGVLSSMIIPTYITQSIISASLLGAALAPISSLLFVSFSWLTIELTKLVPPYIEKVIDSVESVIDKCRERL